MDKAKLPLFKFLIELEKKKLLVSLCLCNFTQLPCYINTLHTCKCTLPGYK